MVWYQRCLSTLRVSRRLVKMGNMLPRVLSRWYGIILGQVETIRATKFYSLVPPQLFYNTFSLGFNLHDNSALQVWIQVHINEVRRSIHSHNVEMALNPVVSHDLHHLLGLISGGH